MLLSFFLLLAFISAFSEAGLGGVAGSLVFAESELASSGKPVFQRGMSYVGWSNDTYNSSDSDESLALLVETNTEWVAISVFWYQTNISTYDIHADPERTPTTSRLRMPSAKPTIWV